MENKVTVVLADANEEFRTMLRQHMEAAGEFLVVGSTDSGEVALDMVKRLRPQPLYHVQSDFTAVRAAHHQELAGSFHMLAQHGPKFLIGIRQYNCYLVFHLVPFLFHSDCAAKAACFTTKQHLSLGLHIIYQEWTGFSRGNCRMLITYFRQKHVNLAQVTYIV